MSFSVKDIVEIYSGGRHPRRRRFETGNHTNKKMDRDGKVYALRRQVMDYIYRAKRLLEANLPDYIWNRIDIRITDLTPEAVIQRILGTARVRDYIIWIPQSTLEGGYKNHLHQIVFHEILHAAFGVEHDESCQLMAPLVTKEPLDPKTVDDLFLMYVKRSLGKTMDLGSEGI